MSGGSLDYIYCQIENIAYRIPDREIRMMTFDFASMLHDLEWYLSTGYEKDDWQKACDEFKKKWFGNRDERLKQIIDDAVQELRTELIEMIGDKK